MHDALQVFSGKGMCEVFKEKDHCDSYEERIVRDVIEPSLEVLQEKVSYTLRCGNISKTPL